MICVPITSPTNKEALQAVKKSCLAADCIELRMDLIVDGNLRQLIGSVRKNCPDAKIIVTCRKKEEALQAGKSNSIKGNSKKTKLQKLAILKEAVNLGADFIDIELAEGEKSINQLKTLCAKHENKTKIIISYHDVKATPAIKRLKEIFNQCAEKRPDVVKIVTYAQSNEDNLRLLSLIPYSQKRTQKIIALCMGEAGRISRIIGPSMGNYLGFVALASQEQSAPGQLTISEMTLVNKLLGHHQDTISVNICSDVPQNYILLGNPVKQSMSPLMHNTALKEMGISQNYSACCVDDLRGALHGLKTMNIHGASITIPFKVEVMQYLDYIDEDATEIGAVNTIINSKGKLTGSNTDWLGLLMTLKEATTVRNKTFAIIGAGGTARAAVYGILKEGGTPILFNRTIQKAKLISEQFGCSFYPLAEISKAKADCLINTTSVGMHPHVSESPVQKEVLKNFKYVMDVIYNPLQTKLLKDAAAQGCQVLSGADMFVHQGAQQLRLWTKKEPPVSLMKKVVLERLTHLG